MDGNNHSLKRRTVLEVLGVGAVSLASTAGARENIEGEGSVAHETLRGRVNNPIATEQVETMRHRFIENNRIGTATAEYALLDANEAFANDKILGYNILTTDNEGPREQYIIQGGTMGTEPETVMNATRVEERLHQKAESMSLKQSLN